MSRMSKEYNMNTMLDLITGYEKYQGYAKANFHVYILTFEEFKNDNLALYIFVKGGKHDL